VVRVLSSPTAVRDYPYLVSAHSETIDTTRASELDHFPNPTPFAFFYGTSVSARYSKRQTAARILNVAIA